MDTTNAPLGSHATCEVSFKIVVSISDSLLMEIRPDVELETRVGIHANDCNGFEDGSAIRRDIYVYVSSQNIIILRLVLMLVEVGTHFDGTSKE